MYLAVWNLLPAMEVPAPVTDHELSLTDNAELQYSACTETSRGGISPAPQTPNYCSPEVLGDPEFPGDRTYWVIELRDTGRDIHKPPLLLTLTDLPVFSCIAHTSLSKVTIG